VGAVPAAGTGDEAAGDGDAWARSGVGRGVLAGRLAVALAAAVAEGRTSQATRPQKATRAGAFPAG